jgi:hypothetical protein
MKILINESQKEKLSNFIYNYIDQNIDIDQLHIDNQEDPEYYPICIRDEELDNIFMVYLPEYWSDQTYVGLERIKKSPILDINSDLENKLNSLFGDLWYEPMKKWFETNFPDVGKIKTLYSEI